MLGEYELVLSRRWLPSFTQTLVNSACQRWALFAVCHFDKPSPS